MQPGTVVDGKYLIDRQLGEGGMAVVLAARHVHLNERVALKVLQAQFASNPKVVERFMREARAAVRLKGEHVVRVLDVGTLPTQEPYIAMEFLDGIDLEGMLKKRGALPFAEVVDYVMQVCEALAEAHAAGIVHRDIKPANCVVTYRADGTPSIKVLDFGIAKMTLADAGPALTATQATMGTPAFMSPEQIRGARDVDQRGDIWSLGVVLFQLITGRVPFMADTYLKLVASVMKDPTPPVANVPPPLEQIIHRCLAKDPAQRFPLVAELAQALEPFANNRAEAVLIVQRCASLARASHPSVATPPRGMPIPLTPSQGAYQTQPPHASPYQTQPPHAAYQTQPPQLSPYQTQPTPSPNNALGTNPALAAGAGTNPALAASPTTNPALMPHPATNPALAPSPAPAAPARKSLLPWMILLGLIAGAIAGVAILVR